MTIPRNTGKIDVNVEENEQAPSALFLLKNNGKRARDQRRQTEKLELLSVIAGGLAHNINNALASIEWNADLIAMDHSADKKTETHVHAIKKNTDQIADIVRALLAYSRKGKYREEKICLGNYLKKTLPFLVPRINPKIKISTFLPRVPLIKIDPKQLKMAVSAILENASEAIVTTGQIEISVYQTHAGEAECRRSRPGLLPGRYVSLEISDTGAGMNETTRDQVFNPFFSTKRFGRGLSMAAVYGIAKSAGGWVYVDSHVGDRDNGYLFFQGILTTP